MLVADSEENLQRLFYRFTKLDKKLSSAISIGKMKCMTISPHSRKLIVDNEPIEQVPVIEIKYVGVLLAGCARLDSVVQEHIMKAARIPRFVTINVTDSTQR